MFATLGPSSVSSVSRLSHQLMGPVQGSDHVSHLEERGPVGFWVHWRRPRAADPEAGRLARLGVV
jgi:hypothetical protein